MPTLGVNIDHVATLRQARRGIQPDPLYAAILCQEAGADALVAHLREDRRHINDEDIFALKRILKVKFNLEMSLADEIVAVACKVKPDQVTLVPEKRQELTTEGGLDVLKNSAKLKKALKKFSQNNIEVSLFIDPDKKQINAAKKLGVRFIELHTGRYADAKNKQQQDKFFTQISSAAQYARSRGITVYAGHGLNYENVLKIARIKNIVELNIGHSIVSRAVFTGLKEAVRQMKEMIN